MNPDLEFLASLLNNAVCAGIAANKAEKLIRARMEEMIVEARKISEKGLKFLEELELFSPTIYMDAGHPAIGFGHDILPGEHFDEPITRDQGLSLLAKDLAPREACVIHYVLVDLNQNQFDAMVSFVYNIGEGAFRKSTLLVLLNQGHYEAVPEQMRRWNIYEGKVSKVLIARREKEISLFQCVPV